jgi:protocatechuate 3,4-dioxygenase beta subunit
MPAGSVKCIVYVMRTVRTVVVCLAAVCCGLAQAPEKCAIRGRVVNAATGAPLKRASVWVEPFSPTRGANGTAAVSGPNATTDAEGRFALENVEPGSYLLSARRSGYLDQGYGAAEPDVVGPPLKLNPGETLGDVTFKMTAQSLLFGKVVDEDGEPMPDAEVFVYRLSYAGGRKQFAILQDLRSQADGSIIVGSLAPGRYYLSADVARDRDPRSREVFVRTYYPDVADPAAARPIEVAAGAEIRGLAIRLRRARVFHIRGRAVNSASGAPAAGLDLHLTPREDALLPAVGRSAATGRDGRFEFTAVAPGSYRIQSDPSATFVSFDPQAGAPAAPEKLFARSVVAVTDSDVEDLTVPVAKGAEIVGRIAGSADPSKRLYVGLVPTGGRADVVATQSDGDGAFRMHSVPPAVYDLAVGGLPAGSYVKSVSFGGQDVTNQNLDLTSGAGGTLEVTLSPDAGEVTGTVHNAKGDPMPGALVQIWPAGGESVKSVKADDAGAFHFRSLPPADYRVAAWEDLDDDLADYPAFRARFESQAVGVSIAQRGHQQVEVKAIPREAAAAEAAKLP